MANFNTTFNIPDDGAWHPLAIAPNHGWFDLTIESGNGRIAVTSDEDAPETGQPIYEGDRWEAPTEGAGYVQVKAEGGALSGTMSGDGSVVA